jgi:hypothetical protein
MTQTGRQRPTGSRIHAESVRRAEARAEDQPSPNLAVNSNIRFDDVISLTEVKEVARRLPPGSTARELLFALNENETRWIALGQLLLIHKFLWKEFKD